MIGNDEPHDFVGALIDHRDLGVAVEALDINALDKAAAAMNLQGFVDNLVGAVRGIKFGHGGFHAVRLVIALQLGCGVDHQAGSTQLGRHIGELKAEVLLEGDGFAKLDALFGVSESRFIGALADAESLRGNADTAAIEGLHGNAEALALFAEQVFLRHFDVVEHKFSCRGGADAHLVVGIAEAEPLPAFFYNEGGNAFDADARSGHGKNDISVGFGCVRDENFAAVKDIVVPVEFGNRFCAAGIGAGIGLGQTEGSELFTFGQGSQIFLFLFFRAEGGDRIAAE